MLMLTLMLGGNLINFDWFLILSTFASRANAKWIRPRRLFWPHVSWNAGDNYLFSVSHSVFESISKTIWVVNRSLLYWNIGRRPRRGIWDMIWCTSSVREIFSYPLRWLAVVLGLVSFWVLYLSSSTSLVKRETFRSGLWHTSLSVVSSEWWETQPK